MASQPLVQCNARPTDSGIAVTVQTSMAFQKAMRRYIDSLHPEAATTMTSDTWPGAYLKPGTGAYGSPSDKMDHFSLSGTHTATLRKVGHRLVTGTKINVSFLRLTGEDEQTIVFEEPVDNTLLKTEFPDAVSTVSRQIYAEFGGEVAVQITVNQK